MDFARLADDGTHAEAPARRLAVRPRHFDRPEGRMVGSIIALALPDEAAVQAWLADEPYLREGVWQDIRVERWRIGAQPYPPLPGGLA